MNSGVSTLLLGATITDDKGRTGQVVTVHPSAQGFGLELTVLIPQSDSPLSETLVAVHMSSIKKCVLATNYPAVSAATASAQMQAAKPNEGRKSP